MLAQSAEAGSAFLQYGALGAIALLALLAVRVLFLRITAAADAERARADRLEEELRRLNAAIQERYLGTLADATRVIGEVLGEIREDRR